MHVAPQNIKNTILIGCFFFFLNKTNRGFPYNWSNLQSNHKDQWTIAPQVPKIYHRHNTPNPWPKINYHHHSTANHDPKPFSTTTYFFWENLSQRTHTDLMITNFTREGDEKYDNQSLKIFLGKHIIESSMVRYNLLHMVWVFSLDNMVGVLAFQFLKYFVSAWCGERRRRWENREI